MYSERLIKAYAVATAANNRNTRRQNLAINKYVFLLIAYSYVITRDQTASTRHHLAPFPDDNDQAKQIVLVYDFRLCINFVKIAEN